MKSSTVITLTLIFLILPGWMLYGEPEGVVKTIPSPAYPYGLTFDGTSLWVGTSYANTGGAFLWKVDTTNGQVIHSIPVPDPNGNYTVKALAFDGTYLWVFEDLPSASHPDKFFKVNPTNGAVLKTINSPVNDYIGGMSFVNGSLWVSQYYSTNPAYNNVIHKIDTTNGAILQTFPTVGEQPMGVAFDGQFIWCAEDTGFGATRQEIYQYDPATGNYTGTFIRNPDNSPRDMAWDGSHFWLIGYYTRLIYKIFPSGGTPNIHLAATSLDFGLVSLGDTAEQALNIFNLGDADLVIQNITFSTPVYFCDLTTYPHTLPPGGTLSLTVSFAPQVSGVVTGVMSISSNDPLDPVVEVSLTGQGQYFEPTIWLSASAHDFGNVWVPVEGKAKWILYIANSGNQNLEIVDLILNQPVFSVSGFSTFPITIVPNDTFPLSVYFQPAAPQLYQDSLIVASTDPSNPFVYVALTGTGRLDTYSTGYVFWQYQVPFHPGTSSYQEYEVDGLNTINDITGDGIDEVVIATQNYWILCLDGGSSGLADTLWSFSTYIANYSAGAIGGTFDYGVQDALSIASDLNGDGFNDVVIGTGGGNEHVYAIDGTNGQIIWQFGTDDPNSYGLGDFEAVDARRDFNNDGVPDVLAIAGGNEGGTGYKSAYLFNGATGSLLWQYPYPGPNLSFGKSIISIDDVTGDGVPDAIIAVGNNETATTNKKTYCLNGATGLPVWDRASISNNPKELLELPIAGQTPDVVVGEYFSTIRRLDGETGVPLWTVSFGGLAGIIQMGRIRDVNNDGIDDILIASFSAGASCLSGATGNYIWTYPMEYQFGIAAIPDINGDGLEDVLVGTGNSSPTFGNFFCISGLGDSVFYSQYFGSDKVYTVKPLRSIDGNASVELLAGTKNGRVICYSGGLSALTAVKNPYFNPNLTYQLEQNFPNPFNPATHIRFYLPEAEVVTLKVFNILGQEVATLISERELIAGSHMVKFDAESLPSGIYIYRLESGKGILNRRMLLLK